MADDFLGSIAQEDVQFVTEVVQTVNPGDNFKHLVVYTDDSQIASGAVMANVKNPEGTVVATYAEVTAESYKNIAVRLGFEDKNGSLYGEIPFLLSGCCGCNHNKMS